MKSDEHIVGEACRIEYSDDGRLFLVFEITDPKLKLDIKNKWTQDIEFRIVDKKLIENNE